MPLPSGLRSASRWPRHWGRRRWREGAVATGRSWASPVGEPVLGAYRSDTSTLLSSSLAGRPGCRCARPPTCPIQHVRPGPRPFQRPGDGHGNDGRLCRLWPVSDRRRRECAPDAPVCLALSGSAAVGVTRGSAEPPERADVVSSGVRWGNVGPSGRSRPVGGGVVVFLGTHNPRLDAKGRLALPARFRTDLAGGLVVTKGQERCLYAFPIDEFTRLTEALRDAPVTARAVRDYSRVFFASATHEVPDAQGRVTLPAVAARVRRPGQGLRRDRRQHPGRDLERRGLGRLPGRPRAGVLRRDRRGDSRGDVTARESDGSAALGLLPPLLTPLPRCQGAPASGWRVGTRTYRTVRCPHRGSTKTIRWPHVDDRTNREDRVTTTPQHEPVLLERVLTLLAPALAQDGAVCVDATTGLGGHADALLRAHPGPDPDRPRPRPARSGGQRRTAARPRRPRPPRPCRVRRDAGRAGPARPPRSRRGAVRSRRLLDAARRGRARLLLRPRGSAGHADGRRARNSPRPRSSTPTPCPNWCACCATTARNGSPCGSPAASNGPGPTSRWPPRRSWPSWSAPPSPPRPARRGGHPAKRTFQALRIEVNAELDAVRDAIPAALEALNVGGRIAVLAYHSLEDRIVKQNFAALAVDRTPVGLPVPLAEARTAATSAHPRGRATRRRRDRGQPARPFGPAPRRGTHPPRRARHPPVPRRRIDDHG